MAQAKMTLEEIRQSDPFLSGGDEVHLDISAYPWLTPLADAQVEDEKFAPVDTRGMGMGSKDLKHFLTHLDAEAVAETKDPELIAKFKEEHGGSILHVADRPFKIYQRENKWHGVGELNGERHHFTATDKNHLVGKLMALAKQSSIRELTESERLQVVRQAQGGDPRGAISTYLEFAIGQRRASSYGNAEELLADPRLAEIFDDCSMLTWLASRPKVEDSAEFHEFLDRYRGGRPLNHDLLDGAYAAFEKQEYTSILPRALQKSEPAPTTAQLDDLDDASVERLMTDTKKQFAREVRAGAR